MGPQDATPDVPSVQEKDTLTSVLFQPAPLGAGAAEPEMVGAVTSRLMVTDCVLVPPALVAEHVNVVPAVSIVTLLDPQPVLDVIVDSGSATVHETPTLLVYQPLLPSVPLTVGVMTGEVLSEDKTLI